MDNVSHFKWELTRDELDTIWWALVDRADRLEAQAKKEKPEDAQRSQRLAMNCRDLQMQINRMRQRYW